MFGLKPKNAFVLLLGDESAVLVYVRNKKVENAWLGPAAHTEANEAFNEALATDYDAPVYLLLDTLEQFYRLENIPNVNIFDQKKVLARQLSAAFSGEGFRLAVPGEKQAKRGNKKQPYLFCGLPASGELTGWLDFLSNVPNPFLGLHLLPLETASLIEALLPGRYKKTTGNRWAVYVAQHLSGDGLRQVVTRNGYMVLTRMSSSSAEDSPSDKAADMFRDARASLAYVKRIGYVEGDALDLVFIASEEVIEELGAQKLEQARSVTSLTPLEAGEKLGLERTGSKGQLQSDILEAVWFACNPKKKPHVRTGYSQLFKPRKIAVKIMPTVAKITIAAAVLFLFYAAYNIYGLQKSLARSHVTLQTSEQHLLQQQQQNATLEVKPLDMRRLIAHYEEMTKDSFAAIDIVQSRLARVFKSATGAYEYPVDVLSIKRSSGVLFEPDSNNRRRNSANSLASRTPYRQINITVALPVSVTNPEEGMLLTRQLAEMLEKEFPDSKVRIEKTPVNVMANTVMTGEAGASRSRNIGDPAYTAGFMIEERVF